MDTINWLSLFFSTITPLIVGALYYHKNVFGKVLLDATGYRDKKISTMVTLIVAIVFSFFLSFFLLNFNNGGIDQEGDFDTFQHGVWHGIFVAVTIASPVIITNGLFGKKSWKSMLIHILYWIITLALMGGILDAMNHWENVPR